jgi:hypothetical protein
MQPGQSARRVAAPHAPVGVFLRFDVVKILSLHDPSDGGSPVPWPLAASRRSDWAAYRTKLAVNSPQSGLNRLPTWAAIGSSLYQVLNLAAPLNPPLT